MLHNRTQPWPLSQGENFLIKKTKWFTTEYIEKHYIYGAQIILGLDYTKESIQRSVKTGYTCVPRNLRNYKFLVAIEFVFNLLDSIITNRSTPVRPRYKAENLFY